MSNQLLSAAVDAAATEVEWDALIEAMGNDDEVMAEWSRVWALRDARDGVVVSTSSASRDFCSGVMTAIANEKQLPSNVLPFRAAAAKAAVLAAPARVARSWRTLVPLSAAAGVVAAVLFVGGLRSPSSEGTAAMSASTASGVAGIKAVSWSGSGSNGGVVAEDDAKAAILNAYVMEHSNSLAERSMGGTLANARFAARTADYRPDAQ